MMMDGKLWGTVDTLNIFAASDIHLASPLVSTASTIAALDAALPDNPTTGALDLIVLPGDVFDRGIGMSESVVYQIDRWIIRLLRLCKKWSITLLISHGTPSHDRGQTVRFTELNNLAEIGADVHYYDVLAVSYLAKYDIHVLYIPDNWKSDPDETWQDVQMAIKNAGITKVDIALTHGFFEHQVPPMAHIKPHLNERYLSVVRKYIFNGHHHTPVVKDRIIVQGSLARIGFGNTEKKGWFNVTCVDRDSTENDTVTFVENNLAILFNTYTLTDMSVSEVRELSESFSTLPKGSNVRLILPRTSPHMGVVSKMEQVYRDIHWKIEPPKKSKGRVDSVVKVERTVEVLSISKRTITDLLRDRLVSNGLEGEKLEEALKMLKGVL